MWSTGAGDVLGDALGDAFGDLDGLGALGAPCDLQCPVCFKSFTTKWNVRYHLRSHTGEQPYRCDVCAVSFRHKTQLARHVRQHAPELQFTCPHCASRFNDKGSFNRHLQLHERQAQGQAAVRFKATHVMGNSRHTRHH